MFKIQNSKIWQRWNTAGSSFRSSWSGLQLQRYQKDSIAGVLLWILRNFPEYLFYHKIYATAFFSYYAWHKNRSCRPEVFCKKGILRNFTKFTGKHMVDWRKAFSLISSRDHCQRSSPSRISKKTRVGFEPTQNLC